MEDALEVLPATPVPWRREFDRAKLLEMSGRDQQALETLRVAAKAYPGELPLELALAEVLYRIDELPEALEHARKAYEELPGPSSRTLLAVILERGGHHQEAYEMLEQPPALSSLAALTSRALAAQWLGHTTEALGLWQAALEAGEAAPEARLNMALCHRMLAESRQAAEYAFEAVILDEKGSLEPTHLLLCAELQWQVDDPDYDSQERVEQLEALIRERYPGNREAEVVRAQIYHQLGSPDHLPPPDLPGADESSGEIVALGDHPPRGRPQSGQACAGTSMRLPAAAYSATDRRHGHTMAKGVLSTPSTLSVVP